MSSPNRCTICEATPIYFERFVKTKREVEFKVDGVNCFIQELWVQFYCKACFKEYGGICPKDPIKYTYPFSLEEDTENPLE